MKDNTKIEFVNHASVLITSNEIGILSDPWYFSSTFNQGWRLIYENSIEYVESVISKSTHIYISHEHPDHFNPKFLLDSKIKDLIIKKDLTFIFQETKDKRVVNFLKKNNFKVKECELDKYLVKPEEYSEKSIINGQALFIHDKKTFYDDTIIYAHPVNTFEEQSIINPFYIGPHAVPFNKPVKLIVNLFDSIVLVIVFLLELKNLPSICPVNSTF